MPVASKQPIPCRTTPHRGSAKQQDNQDNQNIQDEPKNDASGQPPAQGEQQQADVPVSYIIVYRQYRPVPTLFPDQTIILRPYIYTAPPYIPTHPRRHCTIIHNSIFHSSSSSLTIHHSPPLPRPVFNNIDTIALQYQAGCEPLLRRRMDSHHTILHLHCTTPYTTLQTAL